MEKKLFRLSIIFACSILIVFSGRCGHALLNNVVAKLDAFNCSLWIPLDQSFSDFRGRGHGHCQFGSLLSRVHFGGAGIR